MSAQPVVEPTPDSVYRNATRTLRMGVRIATVLMAAGLAVSLARGEELRTGVDPFREIPESLLEGRGSAIVELAILTVMLTPLATVIGIALAFHGAGERRFFRYSLTVVLILCASIALALVR